MVFEHIEKLKNEFTDKWVVVDKNQLELRRFEGQIGRVRTVNMNGHALVEFDANNNPGWYDIGVDFLKIVDAPPPKEEKRKVVPVKPPVKQKGPAPSTGSPASS